MPWWMITYVTLFSLLLAGNTIFWFNHRGRVSVLLYELLSGGYLIFACCAFWYPEILRYTTVWALMPIPPLLAFECYYSIWGNIDALLPGEQEEMSDSERESARVLAVVIASPAYITAAKLFLDTFLQK